MNKISEINPDSSSARSPYFSEEHEMLRAQVRRFVETEIKPHGLAWEEQGYVPREVLRRMGSLGFFGIRYPAGYGGSEMDALATVVLAEGLGRSAFSGGALTAVAVTAPDAGSDAKSLRTFARRDGDSYVIDGAKMFITNGVHANLYCVAAITNPEARPSQRLSMLLVEKGTPGFRVSRALDKHGWGSSHTAGLLV